MLLAKELISLIQDFSCDSSQGLDVEVKVTHRKRDISISQVVWDDDQDCLIIYLEE